MVQSIRRFILGSIRTHGFCWDKLDGRTALILFLVGSSSSSESLGDLLKSSLTLFLETHVLFSVFAVDTSEAKFSTFELFSFSTENEL